jgi:hypothetical protein
MKLLKSNHSISDFSVPFDQIYDHESNLVEVYQAFDSPTQPTQFQRIESRILLAPAEELERYGVYPLAMNIMNIYYHFAQGVLTIFIVPPKNKSGWIDFVVNKLKAWFPRVLTN